LEGTGPESRNIRLAPGQRRHHSAWQLDRHWRACAAERLFPSTIPSFAGIIYQIVVAVADRRLFIFWIINNTAANLAAQNKTTGFDFLWKTAGFDISFSLFPFDRTSYYWEAFLVGLTNTCWSPSSASCSPRILGFTIGIARLSNFSSSRLATVYVETIRNIPLLLQLFFWYFAVLKAMPAVRDSLALPLDTFINQRGLFVPRPLAG
jgi:general L-amino acid transport system permease protein